MKLAIETFLSQDWASKELIIIDDGDSPLMIDSHPLIHLHQLTGRYSVGAKRNIACSRANGDIICHHDDDDYYSPGCMRNRVERLLESGADLSGYRTINFANDSLQRAWEYRGGPDYVLGTSMCYRREYWLRNPFIDVNSGEDNNFHGRASSVSTADGRNMIVARVHGGNTSESYDQLTRYEWRGADSDMWREIDYAGLSAIGYPVVHSTVAS